jgi:hypothetical protein
VLGFEFDENLSGYAAEAAAIILAENWKAAKRDGYADDRLIPDVNDVIRRLQDFRTHLAVKGIPEEEP